MVLIDEFSIKSLFIETYYQQQPLGVATGFVVNKGDAHYLITNWHVASGRNPNNNQPLFNFADPPNKFRVWFHGLRLGQWVAKEITVLNEGGCKLWLEHERGQEIDVVAIPFQSMIDVTLYPIDLELANFDLMLYPSSEVSIIGFPQGLTSGGKFLIWKTGHIASDIDLDWDGKPAFLIDATTKSGMSGSPVIAKRVSIYQTSRGNQVGNAVKFLGVYSGREISDTGIEVGFVWKPMVISEILPNP
jgi:hypothetical protein